MKNDKGKKVLQATSDHEASDNEFDISEFFFMGFEEEYQFDDMEEVDQGELQLAFDDLYFNSLDLTRKTRSLDYKFKNSSMRTHNSLMIMSS